MQGDGARRLEESPYATDASVSVPGPVGICDDWVRETSFGTWFLETKTWRHRVIRVALLDLQRLIPPRTRYPTILDFGCGAGRALRLLDIMFRPEIVIGLDIDRDQLARAMPEAGRCRARVSLRVGTGSRLPVPDRSIDMVFCHQTLHHLTDHDGAIHELYRVLRPGGTLLLAESCRRYIRSLPIRALFRHPMHVQKSAAEYLLLLRRIGFDVRPAAVRTPYPWWSRPDLGVLEWLGRPVHQHEPTLLTVAAVRPSTRT